jgi:hypothetical protein
MRINISLLQIESWNIKHNNDLTSKGFYIRIFGVGIKISNCDLSFSERNGYEKYLRLPFGYKLKFLKKN